MIRRRQRNRSTLIHFDGAMRRSLSQAQQAFALYDNLVRSKPTNCTRNNPELEVEQPSRGNELHGLL